MTTVMTAAPEPSLPRRLRRRLAAELGKLEKRHEALKRAGFPDTPALRAAFAEQAEQLTQIRRELGIG